MSEPEAVMGVIVAGPRIAFKASADDIPVYLIRASYWVFWIAVKVAIVGIADILKFRSDRIVCGSESKKEVGDQNENGALYICLLCLVLCWYFLK